MPTPNPGKFWLCYTPSGRNPQHQHATEALARNEAERLARINPGTEFYVLEAKSIARRVDVVTTDLHEEMGCCRGTIMTGSCNSVMDDCPF